MKRFTFPHAALAGRRAAAAAFTLIELLVVIAIISILAAILFPVFSQAREKARQTACLSNGREIGTAFLMYAQDYDESLVLVSFDTSNPGIGAANSWTIKCQPYIKDHGVFRCPSDQSDNWASTDAAELNAGTTGQRMTSYLFNDYMGGDRPWGTLPAVKSPSSVIAVSEAPENLPPRDHFAPFNWNGNLETPVNPYYSAYMQSQTFDTAKNQTTELAITRHNGGFNNVYLDGHSKWSKWTQVWWQNPGQGVWQGNFDPRQP